MLLICMFVFAQYCWYTLSNYWICNFISREQNILSEFWNQKSGFIHQKIGSENRPLTKIDDLKTDPSQISELYNGPFTKIGDLETDPSQKSETLKRTLKLKIII